MRRTIAMNRMAFVFLLAVGIFSRQCAASSHFAKDPEMGSPGQHKIAIEAAVEKVGKYEKLEMLINVGARYDNPFDPDEVDLAILL